MQEEMSVRDICYSLCHISVTDYVNGAASAFSAFVFISTITSVAPAFGNGGKLSLGDLGQWIP